MTDEHVPIPAAIPSAAGPKAAGPAAAVPTEAAPKLLTPAAQRALAEAAARRAEIDQRTAGRPKEYRGRGGLEPDRYGDWEVKGIASDF
ncbi:DUF1674 domain-containing protein [Rhodoplanes azumiensis]|uniref:DUF1674 domain-containing protein n=1 Tax=Rhodoplanes azumiensis TaxID=1897628 RepID=A0ABW5APD2_9BRAD